MQYANAQEKQQTHSFHLKSDDIQDGALIENEQVYNASGCRGENISPSLSWSSPPEGSKSFAITLYDPDAPKEGGFWHWIAFNIPAGTQHLSKGTLPESVVEIKNDYGNHGYGGPCPPRGDSPHRYILTVYALDIERIPLDSQATIQQALLHIEQHQLAKDSITAQYGQS